METIKIEMLEIIEKILGSSFAYMDIQPNQWPIKRLENRNEIFKNAQFFLGERINQEGAVPPKVLKEVINEGSFCDDTLTKRYYGGILASSRTRNARDDRGATLLKIISQISAYQIRMHYAAYQIIRKLYLDSHLSFTREEDRPELQIFILMEDYHNLMGFSEKENARTILQHVLYGLRKENIIETFAYGYNGLRMDEDGTIKPGLRIRPSAFGAELFLWSYGKADLLVDDLIKSKFKFPNVEGIDLYGNYFKTPKSIIFKQQ